MISLGPQHEIELRKMYNAFEFSWKKHKELTKGQLISKCLFGVFISPKKQ